MFFVLLELLPLILIFWKEVSGEVLDLWLRIWVDGWLFLHGLWQFLFRFLEYFVEVRMIWRYGRLSYFFFNFLDPHFFLYFLVFLSHVLFLLFFKNLFHFFLFQLF